MNEKQRRQFKKDYFLLTSNLDFLKKEVVSIERFVVLFVERGSAKVRVAGKEYTVNQARFLMVRPLLSLHITDASDDFKANVIGFPSTMLHENTTRIEPPYFMLMYTKMLWPISRRDRNLVHNFITLFRFAVADDTKAVYQRELVLALITTFVYGLYSFTYRFTENILSEDSSRSRELFGRFVKLLNENYTQHHQVAFYAEELCISAKYLTQISRRMVGRTPKQIIDERLVYEASVMLTKHDCSIQEISNKLGFIDQSYFGRFFKRFKNVSPQEYRLRPKQDDIAYPQDIRTKIRDMEKTV